MSVAIGGTFDGSTYTIAPGLVHGRSCRGFDVVLRDGDVVLELETIDGGDVVAHAWTAMHETRNPYDADTRGRLVFLAELARRALVRQR